MNYEEIKKKIAKIEKRVSKGGYDLETIDELESLLNDAVKCKLPLKDRLKIGSLRTIISPLRMAVKVNDRRMKKNVERIQKEK